MRSSLPQQAWQLCRGTGHSVTEPFQRSQVTEWDICIVYPNVPAFKTFFFDIAPRLSSNLISRFIKGFSVLWELCLVHASAASLLSNLDTQVWSVKSFKLKPCRTNEARFDAANVERAPTLEIVQCAYVCISHLPLACGWLFLLTWVYNAHLLLPLIHLLLLVLSTCVLLSFPVCGWNRHSCCLHRKIPSCLLVVSTPFC